MLIKLSEDEQLANSNYLVTIYFHYNYGAILQILIHVSNYEIFLPF